MEGLVIAQYSTPHVCMSSGAGHVTVSAQNEGGETGHRTDAAFKYKRDPQKSELNTSSLSYLLSWFDFPLILL